MLERSSSTDSPPPRSPGSSPPPAMPSANHPIKEEENKDESEYMLRWSEHNAQLINVFHQLCQRGEFTDVTLATEGEQFKAHKLVLSACSPYFRHLFTVNPCNHPIVFLKDVPDEHMRLLLEYMYRGSISVKQQDLEEILRTASSLKIRGLTTAEPPIEEADDAPRPLIVDEHFPSTAESSADKFQHVETLSSHSAHSGKSGSRKCDGRKSSAPKKLRLSEDQDSEVSSPRGGGWPAALLAEAEMERRRVEAEARPLASPLQTSSGGSHRSPLDNLPVSDGEELDADQPVDFSTGGGGGKLISSAPRYSILGSYLKTGRSSTTPPEDAGYDTLRRSELAEDLRRAGYGGSPWLSGLEQLSALRRPASRDSRGDSREERNSSGEEHEKDSKGTPPPPLGSLSETLGIDIAGRLRSHFLANLPSHSYAWLNGMGGASLGGSLGGSMASMGSLGTLGSLANLPRGSRRGSTGSTDKMEKNPLGGVRTGEIGTNGKPSVACEVCGKKLADPSSLYRHRKIHSGDKPHKCPYCPRRFIQRYNMKQHIKTHRIELMADQQPFIEQENHHDISA